MEKRDHSSQTVKDGGMQIQTAQTTMMSLK